MDAKVDSYLDRVDRVGARLVELARPLEGLTEPEEGSGERWEAAQVWGHINEFVPYWIEQIEDVIEGYQGEPVPFGRTKNDPLRLQGIESGKTMEPTTHLHWLELHLEDLRGFLRALDQNAFGAVGLHSRLGGLELEKMIEEFLVGHLEEHADQLEALA